MGRRAEKIFYQKASALSLNYSFGRIRPASSLLCVPKSYCFQAQILGFRKLDPLH